MNIGLLDILILIQIALLIMNHVWAWGATVHYPVVSGHTGSNRAGYPCDSGSARYHTVVIR